MGIFSDVADVFTSGTASDIKRRSQRKAGEIAGAGYDKAAGFQQPIYDQALNQSKDLASKYNSGDFSSPDYKAYDGGQFDPNQIFNDPEYKAQLKSGADALEGGAAAKGMLFSGNTARDLEKYGSDLFANRSNDLYSRFTGDRTFGADQALQAYNSGVNNRKTQFQEGQDLAAPLEGAANNLSSNATGKADTLANIELGVGNTRANAYTQTADSLGGLGDDINDLGTQAAALATGNPLALAKKKTPYGTMGQTDLGAGKNYSNIG